MSRPKELTECDSLGADSRGEPGWPDGAWDVRANLTRPGRDFRKEVPLVSTAVVVRSQDLGAAMTTRLWKGLRRVIAASLPSSLLLTVTLASALSASDQEIAELLRRAGIQPIEPPSAAVDLDLEALHGGRVALSSMSGDWLVLTFWATWCQPCLVEMPTLERMNQRLEGRAVSILGVSVDREREVIMDFVKRQALELAVLWDEGGRAARAYKAASIPVTYVIDPSGRIVGVSRGARDWSRLAELFEALLEIPLDSGGQNLWDNTAETVSLPIRLTPPSAEVALSDRSPTLGSTFDLDIRVFWSGDFEEYLLRTPRVAIPEGLEQLGVSAQTRSESGRSVVTYSVSLRAREPGRFALDPVELRYVPRFEQEPVSTLIDGPKIEIAAPASTWGPAGLGIASVALLGGGALAWWGRKRRSRLEESTVDPLETVRGSCEAARHARFEGQGAVAVAHLHAAVAGLAEKKAEPSPAAESEPQLESLLAELSVLDEACRFGGAKPPPRDLDKLQRRVERVLDAIAPEPASSERDRLEIR